MISAVILTHNSQQSLKATLESVSWCDERIVVDDYSFDKTVALSKNLGAVVYERHVNDDFAAQRNFGLEKAKREWVLFVDSDEIVSDELAKEIQKAVNSGNDGYYLKRRDFMWGRELKHGETANIRLLRLAKKTAGKWIRPVHETWNVAGNIGTLHHPLLHSPHPDVAQFIEEINRYSTLNAKYFYKLGVRANMAHIVLYPLAKFFVNYVWRLGFLDGTTGAVVAILMSFHSFLTRGKLYMLARKS